MPRPVFPRLTLASLRDDYRSGRTVEDVLKEMWRRMAARGDDGVWIWRPEWDEVCALARSLCRDPATQPLYGVPFAVKDNIDVAGWPTTAGCPEFLRVAASDASVVARLRAAGAIPIGKTNLDQFATGLVGTRSPYGIPCSVFSERHISGGSSSGSAVAVAAGMAVFSLGTDTAGSGRVPAACNGLVGLKPSLGLVSTHGVVPACRSLDCVSVFAHTPGEATTILDVMRGRDSEDPFSRSLPPHPLPGENPRVGVLPIPQREFFGDDAAATAYDDCLAKAARIGWQLQEIDFTPFAEMARQLYRGPWVAERLAAIGGFLHSHPGAGHPVVRGIIEGASTLTAVDAYEGLYERARLKRATEPVWSGIDALLLPTMPTHYTIDEVLADPITPNTRLGTYTNFVNLLDLCAIALPVGHRRDGLPSSVTLVAPAGADAGLAMLCHRLMAASGTDAPAAARPSVSEAHRAGLVPLAVVGAHLHGQPLHGQLAERRATLLQRTRTAPSYRLYALAHTTPPKPGLVRDPAFAGSGIEVEVYALTPDAFGSFTAIVPPPLAIGSLELADGSWVKGFVCEPNGLDQATDITNDGGWRAYLARISEMQAHE